VSDRRSFLASSASLRLNSAETRKFRVSFLSIESTGSEAMLPNATTAVKVDQFLHWQCHALRIIVALLLHYAMEVCFVSFDR
jgi:hypothetical protein